MRPITLIAVITRSCVQMWGFRRSLLSALLAACNPWLAPEPPSPQPGAPDCAAYCERLEQCEPEVYYDACERDCEGLRVDLEAQRVSGLTDELIACWGSSRTCEQARACDGGEW